MSALLLLATAPSARAISLTEIYAFPPQQSPVAGVIQGSNGNFYGTTPGGGISNNGTVFQVTPAGQLVWSSALDSRKHGANPRGPLVQGSDGSFYGTAVSGGSKGYGSIFRVSPDGVISNLFSFNNANGAAPYGGLVQSAKGIFYGTTSAGGSNKVGTVFQITRTGALTTLYTFDTTNGANPYTGVVIGNDGYLYGVAYSGGAYDQGTLFQIGKTNAFTLIVSFDGSHGANPRSLIQGRDKSFYGVTLGGNPPNGFGTVFKYASNTVTAIIRFGGTNGANPTAPLLQTASGEIWGTTQMGGVNGAGTIFRFGTSRWSTAAYLSTAGIGGYPLGALIEASDGNLYGTTSIGGSSGNGSIFRIDGFAPTIVTPPLSVTNRMGKTAVFSVVASGSQPLRYRWQMGSQILADNDHISGSTTRTLVITNLSALDAGDYTVIVTNSFGAATATASLSVLVDAKAAITSPAVNTRGTNWVIAGTASDSIHPFQVYCWYTNINNGVVTVSDPVAVGTNDNARWTYSPVLPPGTNIVAAQTRNSLHNDSAIATRTFFQIEESPFTLATNGPGTIAAQALISGDAPPTNGAQLNLGESYRLIAKPARNFWFANWSGTIASTNANLTFIMQPGQTLTANFVTNPLIRLAGTYGGLILGNDTVSPQSSGRLTSFKVDANGRYTGKLTVNATNYSLAGNFDMSGKTFQRLKNSDLTLSMQLDFQAAPRQLTGTLYAPNWTAQLTAWAAAAPSPASAATMLMEPTSPPPPAATGYGYAAATGHAGVLTFTGALADGSPLSDSQPITETGQFPLYASLYHKTGMLIGWLDISNGVPSGTLTWMNTATNNAFTNNVPVIGSPWQAPTNGAPVGLTNLSLQIAGGGIPNPLSYAVGVGPKSQIVRLSGATNSLAANINPKTGIVTLTFGTGVGKTTTAASGAMLQNQNIGAGEFQRGTNSGYFLLTPPQ